MTYNHELVANMRHACRPRLQDTQNNDLYQRMRAGDWEAGERLIVDNMPLVIVIVDSYVNRSPERECLRDDLTSEGFLGLAAAVERMRAAETPIKRVNAYLTHAIRHEVLKAALRGKLKPSQAKSSTHDLSRRSLTFRVTDVKTVDTLDLIRGCCRSRQEWRVILLRRRGYTQSQIATRLGCTRKVVFDTLRLVKQRYSRAMRA